MNKNDPKLGAVLTGDEKRDAIHIAIMPVEAGTRLHAGFYVTIRDGIAYGCPPDAALGIVDPFLTAPVEQGQRFYMLLKPYTITSLRHEWTHPLITEPPPVASIAAASREASRKWLEERFGERAEDIILAARRHDSEYITLSFDTPDGLWNDDVRELTLKHLSVVIGREIPSGTHFTCSC